MTLGVNLDDGKCELCGTPLTRDGLEETEGVHLCPECFLMAEDFDLDSDEIAEIFGEEE